jgi:hypothetical protein
MRYRRALAEAIGTFFLVDRSGRGHGDCVRHPRFLVGTAIPGLRSVPYVLAQCIGASAASAVLRTALGPVVGFKEPSWNPPVTRNRAAE